MMCMKLSDEERRMLSGEEGYAVRKSMEILVALGEIYGAEQLIKVGSVQVAGVSYHNLGDDDDKWIIDKHRKKIMDWLSSHHNKEEK